MRRAKRWRRRVVRSATRVPELTTPALRAIPPLRAGALHKKPWAVIDRPYSLRSGTVGALYERPQSISCAKPRAGELLSEDSLDRRAEPANNPRLTSNPYAK